MTSVFPVQCYGCRRLDRSTLTSTGVVSVAKCEAFPAGIPEEIGLMGADHRQAHGGETGGLLFTALNTPDGEGWFRQWENVFGDRGPLVAAVSAVNMAEAARILEQLRRRIKNPDVLKELDLILLDLRGAPPDLSAHLPGQHDQSSHGRPRTGVLGNVLGRLENLRDKLGNDEDRAELDRAMTMLRGLESSDVDDDDLIDDDLIEDEPEEEDDSDDLTMDSATGDLTFIPYSDGDIDVDWDDGSIRFTAASAREVADAVGRFASLPEAPGFPDPGSPPDWVVDQPTYQQWYWQVYREWEQSPAGQANTGTVGEIVTSDGETKVARYGGGVTWIGDPEAVDADDADGVITLDDPKQAREFAEKMREAQQRAQPTTAGYTPPPRRPSLITHLQGQHNQADHAGGLGLGEGLMRMSSGDYHRMFGDAFDEIDVLRAGVTVRVFGDGRAHLAADASDGSTVVLTNSEVNAQEFEELSDDLSAAWDGDQVEILSAADLTFTREPGTDLEVSRSSDGQVLFHLNHGETRQLARAFTEAARSLGALELLDEESADEDELVTVAAATSTMPTQLQAYWLTGEGAAKVRWCTPGSFRRAQRALRSEGVPAHMVDGAVANLYRKACGKSPGRHRGETRVELDTQLATPTMPVLGQATTPAALLKPQPGEHWHSIVHREGVSTGKRTWLPGSVEWREPPFAAHQEVVSSAHGSAPVTVHIGNTTRAFRDGNDLHVYGNIDLGSSQGAEWARRLVEGFGGWPSFGPGSEAFEYDVVHPLDAAIDEPEQVLFRRYRMGEVTFVSVPGQEGTFVEPTAELLALLGREPVVAAVQAPAGPSWYVEIPNLPPPEWFVEPDEYPYGYAVTMTDDGHIFGLLAPHNAAHRTYAQMGERRTLASLGKVDFTRWQKETVVAGGKRVLAGPLTMECMHAPTQGYGTLDRRNQHYQDTCAIFARVAVGNCRNGEGHWINGAAMPGVTSDQVLKFLASDVSGDWQPHPDKPGWVELIAVLAVPSGGWPKSKTGVPSAVTRIRETEHGAIMVASTVPTRFEQITQPGIVVDDEVIYGLAASLGMSPADRVAAEAARIRSSVEV